MIDTFVYVNAFVCLLLIMAHCQQSTLTAIIMTYHNNKMSLKQGAGRPSKNKPEPKVIHANREKSEIVYEMWTEHKRVLIATQLQYMKEIGPKERPKNKLEHEVYRKKYQSGFLYYCDDKQDQAKPFDNKQVTGYEILRELIDSKNPSPESRDLRDIVVTALELKHQNYRSEFIPLYQEICRMILKEKGDSLKDEAYRRQWEKRIVTSLMNEITKNQNAFKYRNILKLNEINKIAWERFLKTQAYCLLAQYFNFRINEYYCEAFEYVQEPEEKERINGKVDKQ